MKRSIVVLLLILAQHGAILTLASPMLPNEVQVGETARIKVFRESYANRMKSFMNTSVNPCDDFYEFACGNYPNVIEDIEITLKQNTVYDISHSIDSIIDKILLKERHPEEVFYEELQKVKKFVEVCDSADLWPLAPNEEYLEVIKAIGGFPALDRNWNSSAFNWFNMTAHLVRYGVVGFIKEDIFSRYPFTPWYEIAKFGFGFDAYSDNIRTSESLGYVHNVEVMKGLLDAYGITGSKADKVIEGVIDFWREAIVFQDKVSEGCSDLSSEDDDGEENKFSQWNLLYQISWNINDSSVLEFVPCPCDFYLKTLDKIAAKKSEAMANYMALKFLYTMHPQVKSSEYQHRHCVTQVKQGLPMVLTHFYMKEYFSEEVRQDVEEMIAELTKSFTVLVETNEWLDERTRFGIQDTLKTLKSIVGQVVDPMLDTYVKETKHLNITSNYAINNMELAKFKVDIHHYGFLYSNISDSMIPLELMKAIWVNAFYDNAEHCIRVLAGILFPPIYHLLMPKSIKYGGLGFIIGHEFVHSLDPRGRFGEKHYKLIHEWSAKSKEAMRNNTQCFIEHHSNFTVPELNIKLNGKEPVTETVCDSGGLRGSLAAYRAISKNIKENNFEQMERLPGLDFSPEQMFFLNFAQVYCAKYEPRHYWSELYEGYPMDKYRVTLPLQNFDEFSKVYNCPLESPMNPAKKCRMW